MANVIEVIFSGKSNIGKTTKNIVADFAKITKTVGKLGLVATAAFAAAGAAIFGVANSVAKTGDEFQKMSQRIGVSTQTLSELAFAADLSGSDIRTVETSLRLLSKRMIDANDGLAEAKDSFDKLGISVVDADGNFKAVDETFMEVAAAMQNLKSDTERTALAQELFGRSGTQLIPLMKAGAKGIAAMREEARNLGITFNDVQANQSAEFIDSMSRLKSSFTGLTNTIGSSFIPILTELGNNFAGVVSEHRELISAKIQEVFESLVSVGIKLVSLFGTIPVIFASIRAASATMAQGFLAVADGLLAIVEIPVKFGGKLLEKLGFVPEAVNVVGALRSKIENLGVTLEGYKDEQESAAASSAEFANKINALAKGLGDKLNKNINFVRTSTEALSDAQEDAGTTMTLATGIQITEWEKLKETIVNFGLTETEVMDQRLQKNLELALAVQATEEEKAQLIITATLETEAFKDDIRQKELAKIKQAQQAEVAVQKASLALQLKNATSFSQAFSALSKQRQKEFTNGWVIMADFAMSAVNSITRGFSQGMATMIISGGKFRDVMGQIFNQIAISAIASLVEIFIKEVVIAKALAFIKNIAAHSGIPFVGLAVGLAAGAAATAAIVGAAGGVALADGGIVTSPTLALIGEAGPEAVIPLSGNNTGLGGSVTIEKLELFPNLTAGETLLSIPRDLLTRWVERELLPVFEDLNRSGKFGNVGA